jgi:hypothetical protein
MTTHLRTSEAAERAGGRRTIGKLAATALSGALGSALIMTASVFGLGTTAASASSSSSCTAAVAAMAKGANKSTTRLFGNMAKACTSLSVLKQAVQKNSPPESAAETKALAGALKKELCLFDKGAKIC